MRRWPISCVILMAVLAATPVFAESKFDDALRRFQIKEHTNAVVAVAISPDGKTLATAGKDKSIRFFDLATNKRTNIIRHVSDIWALAYSGDGKTLAASDGDKNVILWDAITLKEKATITGFETPVAMLALSPDGSLLGAFEDGTQNARIWETAPSKVRAVLEGHGDKIYSIAFAPDGKSVVTASGDETIRIWQTMAGIPGRPLRGHDGPVFTAVFSPDGKSLLSAGTRDKTVRLWDMATYKVKLVLEGHEDEIRFVGFGAGGAMVSLSKDGVVKLWNAEGKETASFLWEPEAGGALPDYATSVAISPDGKTLVVGHDEVVDVWDLTKAKTK